MSGSGMRRAGWLAYAAFLALLASAPARAQAPAATYEVRKGEGLYAIALRIRYEGVTPFHPFQVVIGIYRANQDVFPEGNINVLREGQILRIPSREEVAAIAPAEARRMWQSLTAKPAPPPAAVAAVKPAPAVVAPAEPKPPGTLGRAEQIRRFREGLALERRGDDKDALQAFLEAGESGYGMAQKKLGEIYDKGNSAVQRDYETALKWYQRAREQGVEIPKPFVRSPR